MKFFGFDVVLEKLLLNMNECWKKERENMVWGEISMCLFIKWVIIMFIFWEVLIFWWIEKIGIC